MIGIMKLRKSKHIGYPHLKYTTSQDLQKKWKKEKINYC